MSDSLAEGLRQVELENRLLDLADKYTFRRVIDTARALDQRLRDEAYAIYRKERDAAIGDRS